MHTDKEMESDKHFCVAGGVAFKNWCLQDKMIFMYNLRSQIILINKNQIPI